MFKKTRVRQIIELLQKDLSNSMISEILSVSRNSVARIRNKSDERKLEWDELLSMTDDELYRLFYPEKFKPKNCYAPVDYAYVHGELSKGGVTETLLWEEYVEKSKKEGTKPCSYPTFARGYKQYTVNKNYTSRVEHKPGITVEVDWSGPTMSYIDADTGSEHTAYLFVATLPYSQYTYGEIILNDAYLSFAEHYQVAIIPAAVKKPKQKPSVEGAVGKIARKIIGMLGNETFYSLEGLNRGIRKNLDKLNDKAFQKRTGSRKTIYEVEEKPLLRPLPFIPYEICEWSYEHKVHPNSHIWFDKGSILFRATT